MRDWKFDGEWETHKTGMLVNEEFPHMRIFIWLHSLLIYPSDELGCSTPG